MGTNGQGIEGVETVNTDVLIPIEGKGITNMEVEYGTTQIQMGKLEEKRVARIKKPMKLLKGGRIPPREIIPIENKKIS